MSTAFSFQAQLVSIMDALSKAAVMEIGKVVEIESKMLKIEINRGRNEIASLTEKLHLMEKLLYMAQRGRQDAAAACTVPNEAVEKPALELDEAIPAIKSERTSECISSSTEASTSLPGEDHSSTGLQHPPKEHPELVMVKEEPSEVVIRNTEEEGTTQNNTQKIPDVIQNPKPMSGQQELIYADRFLTMNTQSSPSGAGRKDTLWNPQLASVNANIDIGRSIAQNVASQSLNVLRNLKVHNLRNSNAKRFGCLQCGKNFRCFSQLEIHQRSHTGEKPFRCTLCGKRYAQKGHLYTHQRTHTGEKPYRCPICGKGFIQKCTLDMHQRTHTGEKPFVCMKCGKGFTKNCNLKKHLSVHLDPSLLVYNSESNASTFSSSFMNGTS